MVTAAWSGRLMAESGSVGILKYCCMTIRPIREAFDEYAALTVIATTAISGLSLGAAPINQLLSPWVRT
jgi:hypothetical protein